MIHLHALFLTFIVGIFILIGALLSFLVKNNKKVIDFSISLGFGVIVSLIVVDLIPEIFELISNNNILQIGVIITFIIVGLVILKCLDYLIPDHHDKNNEHNLHHIGLIAAIALIIHNIIEGMAIYSGTVTSFSTGLIMCLGVGLHNIPLGMVVFSTFSKGNIKKSSILLFLVSISTFVGGILMYLLKNSTLGDLIIIPMIAVTLGMLTYIALFELLPQIKKTNHKKVSLLGVAIGITLIIISTLF